MSTTEQDGLAETVRRLEERLRQEQSARADAEAAALAANDGKHQEWLWYRFSCGFSVTDQGYPILPTMTIPTDATAITISTAGQVQVTQPGQTTPATVGQLQLATFINEPGLEAVGDNLFQVSGASGPAVLGAPGAPGFGTVMQGYTEASNVDAVTEITSLISAQRAYEMNSKVVTTADQMLSTTNQMKS